MEVAARQGQIEQMYGRMYETQAQWGEQQKSQAALFRTFAEELNLDMQRYGRDVDSDEVAECVERDVADGVELGVTGIPTFFLNGEKLEPTTTQGFYDAIDEALASR